MERKRKSFKSISGFLNDMAKKIRSMQWNLDHEGNGRKVDVDQARRTSINDLLSQLGYTDRIGPDEKPYDGIVRMQAAETDSVKKKHLGEIRRWFGRQITVISSSVLTNPAGGMTYQFSDGIGHVTILDDDDSIEHARKIAGPNIHFNMCGNIGTRVPDDCKGKLLTEEELYTRVPELRPTPSRSRRARR